MCTPLRVTACDCVWRGVQVRDLSGVIAFVVQPRVWGGAASELVGTFFSKLDMEIKGYGQTK